MQFVSMAAQSGIRTVHYSSFKGVDMSSDPAKIAPERSPSAPNLVSDSGGFPEKRVGWRTLLTLEAPINGIFEFKSKLGSKMLVHAGTRLYDVTDPSSPILLKDGINSAPSAGFSQNDRFWLLTGREYLMYDGIYAADVSDIAKRPITSIGRSPLGGGIAYEDVNLITPRRENRFCADGTATEFQLDTNMLDEAEVEATVNGRLYVEGSGFTVDRENGVVKFDSAPAVPEISGSDNVYIRFEKTVDGYLEKITGCTAAVTYGGGGDGYVFLTGNPEYRAYDFVSALRDPTYFPDNGYSIIGSETTAVMGYARIGEYLAVLKEEDENNSTIFLRSYSLDSITDERTQAVFPLKAGISGTGVIAKRSVGYLNDEPLFLSSSGVCAITSNLITAERTVENRSYFIDGKLCKEKAPENAVCAEWNGRYLIALNDRVYVLDSKQASAHPGDGKKVYECFYWTDIPAVCFLPSGNDLFFGTADGRLCRFNTDISGMKRYQDDGRAICASWSTKADDDGNFMLYKRFLRFGCGIMVKPYASTGCTVRVKTERGGNDAVKEIKLKLFDFSEIDFSDMTFTANDAPKMIPFFTGSKKYLTAQITVENNNPNESFGVFGIMRRYRAAGFLKK